ncbi:hypothetical protein OHS58_17730 [Amycolatopsis sp. NBC_00348]|uniref:hypothetical protein n=1 Tax=Amycolatopsis sp. NBC_00348 TaxID=2975956 RepID=UPI002E2683C0
MRTGRRVLLRSTGVLAPLALAVVALALWKLVVDLAKVPDYLLPAPSAVLASLGESAPLLLGNVQTTAVEVVGGYRLALLTASSRSPSTPPTGCCRWTPAASSCSGCSAGAAGAGSPNSTCPRRSRTCSPG